MKNTKRTAFTFKKENFIRAALLFGGTILACGWLYLDSRAGNRPKELVINEVCSNNYTVCEDINGEWPDYIELHNLTAETIDLENYYLSDGNKGKVKNQLAGRIEPGGYMLLWADGAEESDGTFLSFKLDSENGERLYLSDSFGSIVDEVTVPPLAYNTVYARANDGERWGIFTPTPGRENASAQAVLPENLQSPVFSCESGFYEESFYLEMSSESGEEIYYTLDGSIPTDKSFHYTAPILIEDRSSAENTFSSLAEVSPAYQTEVMHKYAGGQDFDFRLPSEEVDKCSVVRAVCIGKNGKSPVTTASYFVGFGEKEGYDNLMLVSLVLNPADLFDRENGIYVLGEAFENCKIEEMEEDMRGTWEEWDANYQARGRSAERPAEAFFFSTERELLLKQELGVRIKGGHTRSYPQKSFNLYARQKLDGKDKMQSAFFDEPYFPDTVALATGGNDYISKLKDYLVFSLVSERSFSTMDMIPAAVFVNGEYWGVYYLSENFKDSYFSEYYGVNPDNVVTIKSVEDETWPVYLDLLVKACDTNYYIESNYDEICQEIDIQNYMEYVAAQVYIARCSDWPQSNFEIWKVTEKGDGAYEDGRWRWMLYDVNSENCEIELPLLEHNGFEWVKKMEYLFPALVENEGFRIEFTLIMQDMMNVDFAPERVDKFIDDYLELMEEPMKKNYERYFDGKKDEEDFRNAVEDIRTFFRERAGYVYEDLRESGFVDGSLGTVTITLEDGESGDILLNNRTVLDMESGEWNGTYYTDFPITLEAMEQEGFRFVRWEGDISSTEKRIEVPVTEEGVHLKAVFEKR